MVRPLEVRPPTRRTTLLLAGLATLAVVAALAPPAGASHYTDSCDGLAPLTWTCTLTVPNAHLPEITVTFGTAGPPPFTGHLRLTIVDATPPDTVIDCGPFVGGANLGACMPDDFTYASGSDVDVDIEALSLAKTGPGTGDWTVVVRN